MLLRTSHRVTWRRLLTAAILVLFLTPLPLAAGFQQDETLDNAIRTELERTGQVDLSVEFAADVGGSLEASRSLLIDSLPALIEVLPSPTSVAALSVRVRSSNDVAALQSNVLVQSVVLPPGDPTFTGQPFPGQVLAGQPEQSGELNVARPVVGADQMHQVNIRGRGQTIAVIDSGIDASHPDLTASVVFERCHIPVGTSLCPNGTDLQTGPGSAADDNGHGTNIAGVLASNGTIAPVGIAPDVQLEIYKVGDLNGLDFGDTLLALDYILTNRPDVQAINFSITSARLFTGPCPRSIWPAFFDIITALRDRGTIVVAPTGNQFTTGRTAFPACLEPVISVAGSTVRENLLPASNIDNATDIAAPSQGIATTGMGGTVQVVTGTSFAVPIVVACAALMIEDDGGSALGAMERLTSGQLVSGREGFSAPWIDCAPRCHGTSATVNLELGQLPTSADDVILGTGGDDEIVAGQGDDIICGLDGDDTIVAGFGDDVVLAGKGNDTVYGGGGRDLINGQLGNDVIFGGDDNDALFGSLGDDFIAGGPGADFIIGKAGRDTLEGGDGNDVIGAGRGSDIVSGGPGNDLLLLGTGSDRATGDAGDDRLVGEGGWDELDGGPGVDECDGGFGIDQALACEVVLGVP